MKREGGSGGERKEGGGGAGERERKRGIRGFDNMKKNENPKTAKNACIYLFI